MHRLRIDGEFSQWFGVGPPTGAELTDVDARTRELSVGPGVEYDLAWLSLAMGFSWSCQRIMERQLLASILSSCPPLLYHNCPPAELVHWVLGQRSWNGAVGFRVRGYGSIGDPANVDAATIALDAMGLKTYERET